MIVELKDKPKENQVILLKFDSNKDTFDIEWYNYYFKLMKERYPKNEIIGLLDVDFDVKSKQEVVKILQKEIKKLRREIRKEQK